MKKSVESSVNKYQLYVIVSASIIIYFASSIKYSLLFKLEHEITLSHATLPNNAIIEVIRAIAAPIMYTITMMALI
jgi:hypothetical protein